MWLLVVLLIAVVLFALRFFRSPLWRARKSGHEVARSQGGWDSTGAQSGYRDDRTGRD